MDNSMLVNGAHRLSDLLKGGSNTFNSFFIIQFLEFVFRPCFYWQCHFLSINEFFVCAINPRKQRGALNQFHSEVGAAFFTPRFKNLHDVRMAHPLHCSNSLLNLRRSVSLAHIFR